MEKYSSQPWRFEGPYGVAVLMHSVVICTQDGRTLAYVPSQVGPVKSDSGSFAYAPADEGRDALARLFVAAPRLHGSVLGLLTIVESSESGDAEVIAEARAALLALNAPDQIKK